MRPISNVVDATNYVMLELNQPMHAYDAATLRGPALVVRRARAGESLVTLDGVARTLDADTTVIADAEGCRSGSPASWAAGAPRSATAPPTCCSKAPGGRRAASGGRAAGSA